MITFSIKKKYFQTIKIYLQEKLADDQLSLAAIDRSEGKLVEQLDVTLKSMNVERQAYHGKAFIGNHVHICCKVTI